MSVGTMLPLFLLGVSSQPALVGGDRAFASAEASGAEACPVITIRFNGPIKYFGKATEGGSTEVRLSVEQAQGRTWMARDQLGVPPHAGPLRSIEYRRDSLGGPTMNLLFSRETAVDVALGDDSSSLQIKVLGTDASCEEQIPSAAAPLDPSAVAAAQAAAEDAFAAGDRAEAQRQVDEVLRRNPSDAPSRILELDGMLAHLDGEDDRARASFEAARGRATDPSDQARIAFRIANLKPARNVKEKREDRHDGAWRTRVFGSLSSFYSRDTSINRFANLRRPEPNVEIDERTNIDQLLTTADVTVTANNGRWRTSLRMSGSQTSDFRPVTLVGPSRGYGDDRARIYDLSLDLEDQKSGFSTRLGRQTMFRNGVYGRFDGVSLALRLSPTWRLEAQGGFPQFSPRTDLVDRDRRFVGVALRRHRDNSPLEIGAYGYSQFDRGVGDRQAVGLDARYSSKGWNLYGVLDYDLRFSRLSRLYALFNVAIDKASLLSIEAHHFYDPPLAIHNAVLGQPTPDLGRVSDLYGRDLLKRIALDRSSLTDSISIAYSRELATNWRLTLDATMLHAGERRASAGVEATPSETQLYAKAQLTAASLMIAGDTIIAAMQVARTPRFRAITTELGARFPVTPKLGVEPRIEYRYRTDRFGSGYQRDWRPNVRMTYQLFSNLAIDAEIGRNLFRQKLDDAAFEGRARERATIYNAGVRWTF